MVQENRAKLPTNAHKELLAVMSVGFFFICFQTQAVEFGMDKPYQGDNFTGYFYELVNKIISIYYHHR